MKGNTEIKNKVFIVEVRNSNITAKGIKYCLDCGFMYSKARFIVKTKKEG